MMPRVSQCTEILQRFYGAPSMSEQRFYVNSQRFCRDFMVPQVCQFTEILQRFYGAPYKDFLVSQVCQFTEILQRFNGASSMSAIQGF